MRTILVTGGAGFVGSYACKALATQWIARRPGDPPTLINDSAKAGKLLGWTPKFPELREQISHAFKWFENQSADAHHLSSEEISPISISSVSD